MLNLKSIFGFKFRKDNDKDKIKIKTPIAGEIEGGIAVDSNNYYYFQNNQMDPLTRINNEISNIDRYRNMDKNPEVSNAIDDICDEAIVNDGDIVNINLDEIDESVIGDDIKKQIIDEFNVVLSVMNFNKNAWNLFRRWYVDGKLFLHILVDEENPQQGVKQFKYIDPRLIVKIQEYNESVDEKTGTILINDGIEYFLYNRDGIDTAALTGDVISIDSVAYAYSGITDPNGIILSNLHRSIKPLNQLQLVEDSSVVYRLTRAPERRVFYVDCGRLNTKQTEQHVQNLMNAYKNQIQYNTETGEISNDREFLAMTEDFWMPRQNGKQTEVDTLPGGANLDQIEDIAYFHKKFLQSLKVPVSRYEENNSIGLGRTSEINRDELKFNKFIRRLLVQFADVLKSSLRAQLLIKNVLTVEEWNLISNDVNFEFNKDSYFSELKDMEILNEKLSACGNIEDYIGKYFSKRYVQKNILKMSDDEIEQMNKEIKDETKSGEIENSEDNENERTNF